VVSSEGGKLQELTLKYRGGKPMVIVGDLGPAGLLAASGEGAAAAVVAMNLSAESVTVTRDRPSELLLTGEVEGFKIRQTLSFRPDTFAIDVFLRVENGGTAPRGITLTLPWITRQAWRTTTEKFQGQHPTEIVWSTNGHVERIDDLGAISGERPIDGDWVGLDSVWYLAALAPAPRSSGFRIVIASDGKVPPAKNGETAPVGRASIALRATPTIAPGQAWEGGLVVYAGPKEYDRLKALGLEDSINFGGFPLPQKYGGLPMRWLGVPILLLMNWTYQHETTTEQGNEGDGRGKHQDREGGELSDKAERSLYFPFCPVPSPACPILGLQPFDWCRLLKPSDRSGLKPFAGLRALRAAHP